eukprot:scaffold214995_cov39-Attheya_sp.AAC.2
MSQLSPKIFHSQTTSTPPARPPQASGRAMGRNTRTYGNRLSHEQRNDDHNPAFAPEEWGSYRC